MKNTFLFLTAVLFSTSVIFYSSCKKKDTTPAATCSDGIQNQGETGIDCGGPCTACATSLCSGNSSNNYFPLANSNFWQLDDINPNDYVKYNVTGTAVYNSLTYFKITITDIGGSYYMYLRQATNGDVYYYETINSTEYLYIPAAPTVNQSYPMYVFGVGSRKVISTTASVTTSDCTYTGCLKIQDYDGSGNPNTAWYYKKGVGLVSQVTFTPLNLDHITLH